jgi:hypothetical protein
MNPIHPLHLSYRSFDRVGSSVDQRSWFQTMKSRVQIPSSPKYFVFGMKIHFHRGIGDNLSL